MAPVVAQSSQSEGRPVYQRQSTSWRPEHDRHRRHHNQHSRVKPQHSPQVSSGWFQRPYPYHLDYYKMRYGGSYEPYFGNLYGPPVIVAPQPFFGGYGYGGGIGPLQGEFGNAQPGFGGAPWGGQPGTFIPFTEPMEEPGIVPAP